MTEVENILRQISDRMDLATESVHGERPDFVVLDCALSEIVALARSLERWAISLRETNRGLKDHALRSIALDDRCAAHIAKMGPK